MSTVKLIIRKKSINKKGLSLIFIQYHHNGQTTLLSTKEKIEARYWNQTDEQVKKSHKSYQDINSVIYKEKERLEHIVRQARFNNIEPDINYVIIKFREQETIKTEEKPEQRTLIELFDSFIAQSETIKKASTINNYKVVRNHLLKYEDANHLKLQPSSIEYSFYESFTLYLIKTHQQSNNTLGRNLKILKVFVHHLEKIGIKVNNQSYKVQEEETGLCYVTEEELMRFIQLDLSEDRTLEEVRDRFCFACLTGLRFSDQHLKDVMVKSDSILLQTTKTKDNIVIPLNKYTKAILNKYKQGFTSISNRRFNEQIQEVAKKAGLNEEVTQIWYSGSKRIEEKLKKYQCITSHCARRTFITLSLEKGMRAEVVMQITGIRNFRTLQRYIKITDKVKGEEMKKVWGETER